MTENTLIVLEDKSVANIQFNFEELKSWALAKVEKYQNLTITEEQVIDIKKEMADINKYSKEIDAKRKEFEKQYKARIDPVLAQILEIKGIFDSAYNGLKTQVDNFETIEREKRRIAIKEQIEEIIRVEGLQQYAKRFEIQEKWLNKTTSQKSIKADLDNIVADIKSWIETQEKAIKMREERIQMVSEFYKAKVESYGFDLGKESYFIAKCDQCEGTAITVMINSAFEAELKYREARKRQEEEDAIKEAQKQAEAEAKAKKEADEITPKENEIKDLNKENKVDEITPNQEKILTGSVRFTFKESNFEKIKGLMGQIKQLCETWENE